MQSLLTSRCDHTQTFQSVLAYLWPPEVNWKTHPSTLTHTNIITLPGKRPVTMHNP